MKIFLHIYILFNDQAIPIVLFNIYHIILLSESRELYRKLNLKQREKFKYRYRKLY